MKNSLFLKSVGIGLGLTTTPFLFGQNVISEKAPPNIVMIFIDDMGYADVGCFGATKYKTPNIDKIAQEGIRFTNFYASTAVCSASRASLLSGCYSERVGIRGALMPWATIGLNPKETIIPEVLKNAGYTSAIFGKWHLGHQKEFLPLQQGFDYYYGLPYSNDMWPVGFDGVPILKNVDGKSNWKANYPPLVLIEGNNPVDTIATLEDQGKLTTIYTEKAVKFIENHNNKPFFLYLPHSMVHVPIAVSDKFKAKSGEGLFADVMMELDWSVGQILDALERNGLTENTLVIFTSDNGPWLNFGNHAGSAFPLREGKGDMWEGGCRVSCVMKWPKVIKENTVCHELASTIDLLPTFASINNLDLPENKIDGVNILSLLDGTFIKPPREDFLYYYSGELIAVRKGDWKLVFPHTYRSYKDVVPGKDGFPGPYAKGIVSTHELYNLAEDISEQNNVIAMQPEIVAELMILGEHAREELGDKITGVKGKAVREPGRIIRDEANNFDNLAKDAMVNLTYLPSESYSANGVKTLFDNKIGSLDFADGRWLGFSGDDLEAEVQFKEAKMLSGVNLSFVQNQNSWIFLPTKIIIEVSVDGKNFVEVHSRLIKSAEKNQKIKAKIFKFELTKKEYKALKITAKSVGINPDWHSGSGEKSWLFCDEIIVR